MDGARVGWRGKIAVLVLMLAAGAAVLGAGTRPESKEPRPASRQEATVVGIVVHPRSQQPIVVLEGRQDKRRAALVIGPTEATGIAVPLHNITPPRPLTHDLFLTVFGRLNVTVRRVIVTDLRNDVYYATLVLDAGGTEIELDSRPSDAIALALRAKAPVLVEDRVFDKAEKLIPAPAEPGKPSPSI
jgi:bifunctional DNase/RNase